MKERGCAFRIAQVSAALMLLLLLTVWLWFVLPLWGIPFNYTRHTQVPATPAWALECWLWEDDVNTADFVRELVAGYEQYDIPARTVLIDSPWSTRYNDFALDTARYNDDLFRELQDRGYRVVLWMTPLVNSRSDDTAIANSQNWHDEAAANGYLTDNGDIKKWWKGEGGYIDYTNPEAMEWWRGMQQRVFDLGIDGWKLDGAATLNFNKVGGLWLPYIRTREGIMTTRGYMDHYYRDEYRHGLKQNPEFITLARSIDDPRAHPEGFAPYDAAPVTWVGDQDHTWSKDDEGLEEALGYIMRAAKMGYCVIGSDVAGYGGSDIQPEVYIRWAQFSAFCGLFLNGGHGERRLWLRTPKELEIIRQFAWLHNELVPYIYTHVVDCSKGGRPLMRPEGDKYAYYFGYDFFVSPVYTQSTGNDTTPWNVHLPEGRWRYLFSPREVITGPQRLTHLFPLREFPAYVRDGAIVPLNVSRPYTGYGDRDSAGFLTWLVFPYENNSFTVHHPDGSGDTTVKVEAADTINIRVEGVKKPHILRVHVESAPKEVSRDGAVLPRDADWQFVPDRVETGAASAASGFVVVRTQDYGEGRYRITP